MSDTTPKNVLSQYMDLIDYAIYHAPILRNHKEFGDRMRDVRFEIGEMVETYNRITLAAKGRGMVSEMDNIEEVAVLVCGLHDKILRLEAELSPVKNIDPNECPYCHGTGKGKLSGIEVGCNMCERTGKINH
jgi:hypothetical protein